MRHRRWSNGLHKNTYYTQYGTDGVRVGDSVGLSFDEVWWRLSVCVTRWPEEEPVFTVRLSQLNQDDAWTPCWSLPELSIGQAHHVIEATLEREPGSIASHERIDPFIMEHAL